MRLVKSVFRHPPGERVFDPAEKHVDAFNALLKRIPDERLRSALDFYAEQIINVRLMQDNTIYEGSETGTMYHERRRGESGVARENSQ